MKDLSKRAEEIADSLDCFGMGVQDRVKNIDLVSKALRSVRREALEDAAILVKTGAWGIHDGGFIKADICKAIRELDKE